MKARTTKDWILDLPKPIAAKALYYLNEDAELNEYEYLSSALWNEFIYKDTEDSKDYWSGIIAAIRKGELLVNEVNQTYLIQ